MGTLIILRSLKFRPKTYKRLLAYLSIIGMLVCFNAQAQSITSLEYYFGDDPGFGNGTTVTADTNTGDLTQSFGISIVGIPTGFEQLSIRALDSDGVWSLYSKRVFYVSSALGGSDPISNLAAAEYWFDEDPGIGSGTMLTINGNPSELTQGFAIPLGSLSVGFHTISIRIQNLDGIWSTYSKRTFYVSEPFDGSNPISNLQTFEYWFDEDPGFGNGTSLAISGSPSEATESFVLPLDNLEPGFHALSFRAQNLDGTWSHFNKRPFYIFSAEENSPPAALTEAEFLFDEELGFGTGTTVPITATGNPDEYLVEIPTDMVSCDVHDLWLSIKNANGSYSLYNIAPDIEVFDDAPPTIVVFPDITAELDANGEASITLADVDNGTFDDCELVSVELNQAQFDYTCANLGENTVTITATDAEAKVSTQDVTITVVDLISPVAISQNVTVQLDTNGNATISGDAVDDGSTDNCSIASTSLDISSFTCADLGDNTVILTVTDQGGNTNDTSATVTVVDSENPVAIAQNITVQLDASGNASITATDIDNNSTDNCSIASRSLDLTSFTCAELGANTVTLTVTDQSGNVGTTTAVVTVEDSISPIVFTQDVTVQLDASGNATISADDVDDNSTDNCSIASTSINISSFTCADLGANTVTLTVTDQSGNNSAATAVVTVEDTINPIAVTQDVTVQLDANGEASITVADVENGSTDNCTIVSSSLDITDFTCDGVGDTTVTLSVTDQSNNTGTATAIVTVEDKLSPFALGQDITIDLAGNASISIVPEDVDNGSFDNCAFSLSIDIDTFTAPGDYPVTLTITDASANNDSITVIVTVIDSTLSISENEISANDITLYPVPTSDVLHIKTDLIIDELELIDVSGKRVLKVTNPENTLYISSLSEGVYFIEFKLLNTTLIKRFVKH